MAFIKATAIGNEFIPDYEVEKVQIYHALKTWLSGGGDRFQLEQNHATKEKIHSWNGYFRVEINRYLGDTVSLRSSKQRAAEGLVDLFPKWRKKTSSFEQDLRQKLEQSANNYIESYKSDIVSQVRGSFEAMLESTIKSQVVPYLMSSFPQGTSIETSSSK